MVVIRISYHQLNSIWAQIGHELTMNVGENILHGAVLLQNFYRGLSKSNFKSIYCTSISMMFKKNNSLLPHSIWFQIGHDLTMNIGVVILHGANLLQSVFLRSHLPTIFPTKLSSTLNIKPGFSTKSISKMAAVTLDSHSLEDYLASQPHILEPYISSEIAEIGFLPSIIFESDLNFWKEVLNTHSSPHQARKDCSCYQACQAYLMPDTVNIQPLTSSLRYFDISSEITEVDPLLSLIREQFSKKDSHVCNRAVVSCLSWQNYYNLQNFLLSSSYFQRVLFLEVTLFNVIFQYETKSVLHLVYNSDCLLGPLNGF
jgi:hypothetical protein